MSEPFNDLDSDLDLIDLINERYGMLRKMCEKMWNDHNAVPISSSEWQIMARIYKKSPTIAHIAKQAGISRQAAHKFVKKMENKGLIEFVQSNNNKDKCVRLTEFGTTCFEKNKGNKTRLERLIADKIGPEPYSQLKTLLKADWGLQDTNG